ncbi:hypothetical protein H0264_22600 [Nocardia huaxiensis]|uniref:Uncharacterized protein n=1 Tax=Nocardia huaxiensis TaxID=2755382 RepID=A0A7D6ZEQ9_9NOCA|nr:hypothetical protein [Nocardia huaxiensis]QLY28180.1 hypothetical protein H0264_22600 [Nocardia huaxiensis]
MEFVIGLLVAWAVPHANRARKKIGPLTGAALDVAIDRVGGIVDRELGRDPAIVRLIAEARAGTVTPQARASARRALDRAAAANPDFAAELHEATEPQPTSVSRSKTDQFAGVNAAGAQVAGDLTITNTSKIVNYAKDHPGRFLLIVIIILAAAGLLAAKLNGLTFGEVTTATTDPTVSHGNPNPVGAIDQTTKGTRTTPDSSTITGSWTPSDNTGTKTFTTSGGQCDGFYYAQGTILDIGGPMTCVISEKPNAQGRYTLVVTQSPNRSTYTIEFPDTDHAVVYDSKGTRLYELERL